MPCPGFPPGRDGSYEDPARTSKFRLSEKN